MNAQADDLPAPRASLEQLQQQLANAAMGQGIPADNLMISAYINGLLQSARVSAISKYLIKWHPGAEAELTAYMQDTLEQELIPRLEANRAPVIQSSVGRRN